MEAFYWQLQCLINMKMVQSRQKKAKVAATIPEFSIKFELILTRSVNPGKSDKLSSLAMSDQPPVTVSSPEIAE